ncbi:MAG: hypothetical protein NVSMB9_13340 [Isosphaeraceae bacterium]
MNDGLVESRHSSRYLPAKPLVYLGWWEEPEFRTCAAALRNLGHGGALIHVGLKPPTQNSLWLCMAGSPPRAWVEVLVVSMTVQVEGTYLIRLKFPEICPYEMFQEAVLGWDLDGATVQSEARGAEGGTSATQAN